MSRFIDRQGRPFGASPYALPTGKISMSQVNTELNKSASAPIGLNDVNVRKLAERPSGTISMSNLQGKTNAILYDKGLVYLKMTDYKWSVGIDTTDLFCDASGDPYFIPKGSIGNTFDIWCHTSQAAEGCNGALPLITIRFFRTADVPALDAKGVHIGVSAITLVLSSPAAGASTNRCTWNSIPGAYTSGVNGGAAWIRRLEGFRGIPGGGCSVKEGLMNMEFRK